MGVREARIGRCIIPAGVRYVEEGGEGFVPATNCQGSLGKVLEVIRMSAEGREFSCIIFPEELALVKTPLRSISAVNVGVLWVRHDGGIIIRSF